MACTQGMTRIDIWRDPRRNSSRYREELDFDDLNDVVDRFLVRPEKGKGKSGKAFDTSSQCLDETSTNCVSLHSMRPPTKTNRTLYKKNDEKGLRIEMNNPNKDNKSNGLVGRWTIDKRKERWLAAGFELHDNSRRIHIYYHKYIC